MSSPFEDGAVMLCDVLGEYCAAIQKHRNGYFCIPPIFIVGKILNPEVLKTHNKNWTEKEIKEADRIVVEALQNLAKQKKTLIFNGGTAKMRAGLVDCTDGLTKKAVTIVPSKSDIPNKTIGMCVATCKLLHKPIPKFILDK